MLRGLPHLAKYMPEGRDARRLVPDPETEPDFYSISRVFPLPDEKQNLTASALAAASEIAPGHARLASQVPWIPEGPPTKIRAVEQSKAPVAMMGMHSRMPSSLIDVSQARSALLNSEIAAMSAVASAGLHTQLLALQKQKEQQQQQVSSNATLSALAAYLQAAGNGSPAGKFNNF